MVVEAGTQEEKLFWSFDCPRAAFDHIRPEDPPLEIVPARYPDRTTNLTPFVPERVVPHVHRREAKLSNRPLSAEISILSLRIYLAQKIVPSQTPTDLSTLHAILFAQWETERLQQAAGTTSILPAKPSSKSTSGPIIGAPLASEVVRRLDELFDQWERERLATLMPTLGIEGTEERHSIAILKSLRHKIGGGAGGSGGRVDDTLPHDTRKALVAALDAIIESVWPLDIGIFVEDFKSTAAFSKIHIGVCMDVSCSDVLRCSHMTFFLFLSLPPPSSFPFSSVFPSFFGYVYAPAVECEAETAT